MSRFTRGRLSAEESTRLTAAMLKEIRAKAYRKIYISKKTVDIAYIATETARLIEEHSGPSNVYDYQTLAYTILAGYPEVLNLVYGKFNSPVSVTDDEEFVRIVCKLTEEDAKDIRNLIEIATLRLMFLKTSPKDSSLTYYAVLKRKSAEARRFNTGMPDTSDCQEVMTESRSERLTNDRLQIIKRLTSCIFGCSFETECPTEEEVKEALCYLGVRSGEIYEKALENLCEGGNHEFLTKREEERETRRQATKTYDNFVKRFVETNRFSKDEGNEDDSSEDEGSSEGEGSGEDSQRHLTVDDFEDIPHWSADFSKDSQRHLTVDDFEDMPHWSAGVNCSTNEIDLKDADSELSGVN